MAAKKKTTTKTKTTAKRTASSKTRVAATKPAAKKDAKAKPNRTFAIRVTDAELAAIHEASGPRRATRYIRAVAAAFANADVKAFEAVVKEARQASS